ncbi:Protein of unknown function, partial [Gryllus bimaculatus]
MESEENEGYDVSLLYLVWSHCMLPPPPCRSSTVS